MKEIKVLIFKLGKEFYATNIMEVERILGYENPTILPDSPEFLEGIIDYENTVLPIINLANKFNLDESKDIDKRIIVIKRENLKFGILVDSVTEVITILEENIKSPSSLKTLISKKYINGFIKEKENIIIMINLEDILTLKEEEIIFQR